MPKTSATEFQRTHTSETEYTMQSDAGLDICIYLFFGFFFSWRRPNITRIHVMRYIVHIPSI